MGALPTATVVYVARDRWAQAPATLDALLAATDVRHPVVVVDGGASRPIARALDVRAATERVRLIRTNRFLGSNEARNVGAEGATTEWIAFVENDVVLSDGWLDALLRTGERVHAQSVYPAYLENRRGAPVVHGLGCDLELYGPEGARRVRERNHLVNRPWADVRSDLEPVERVQAEPHAVVVRRELLDRIGGLDEGLTGWFEHLDLALHQLQLGAPAWLVPEATCTYLSAPPVAPSDLRNFSLRWGTALYDASFRRLCAVWGLDPAGSAWNAHESYRHAVRRRALRRAGRFRGVVERAAAPIDGVIARRWIADRRAGSDGPRS